MCRFTLQTPVTSSIDWILLSALGAGTPELERMRLIPPSPYGVILQSGAPPTRTGLEDVVESCSNPSQQTLHPSCTWDSWSPFPLSYIRWLLAAGHSHAPSNKPFGSRWRSFEVVA